MSTVSLDTPVTLVPASAPITTDSFKVVYIEESYGWDAGQSNDRPLRPRLDRGEVVANVILSEDPYIERRITVWEGEAYLAVRGTWTDQTLYQRIKEILQTA